MILRKRRELQPMGHILDVYFQTHLSWLNAKQKMELQQMTAEGASRSALQEQIYVYYSKLYGSEMLKAREQIRNGCWEVLTTILDADSVRELNEMRAVGGVSEIEVGRHAGNLLNKLNEDNDKKWNHHKELGPSCRKLLYINDN